MTKDTDDTKIAERIAKDKQAVIEQLKKIPIVQIACERADVGRSTYYRWCKDDEDFAVASSEALSAGKAMINDMAESGLIGGIKDQSLPAIRFWLNHNHPDYTTKVELTQKTRQEALTPEQIEKLSQAVKLFLPASDEQSKSN